MKKVLFNIFLFLIISFSSNAAKLSEIKGIESLNNSNELKDVEAEKIVENNELSYNKLEAYLDGKAYTGIAIIRENNKIIGISFFKDGWAEKYLYYNKKGILTDEFEITSGEKGIIKKYYENTDRLNYLAEARLNENNEIIFDGSRKIFKENGVLVADLKYKDGSMVGLAQKIYFPNGNLKYYAIAANNDTNNFLAKGRLIEYYENGKVKEDSTEVSNGTWICKSYDENGKYLGEKVDTKNKGKVESNFFTGAATTFLKILIDLI